MANSPKSKPKPVLKCDECSRIKRILLQLKTNLFTVESKTLDMDFNRYHMFYSQNDDGDIEIYLKKKP